MSFKIRQTFKAPFIGGNQENDNTQSNPLDSEKTQRIIDTINKFNQKSSHKGALTHQELANIIKNSSINPETNPAFKEQVDKLLESNYYYSEETEDEESNDMASGFSSNLMNTFSTTKHKKRLDNELKKELDAIMAEYDTPLQENDDNSNKKSNKVNTVLNPQFPARASMLRGYKRNAGSSINSIKKTAYGMVDSF